MKFGIVVFPGTWSDTDCFHVVDHVFHQPVEYVWHKETDLSSYDCVVLPGGFSYGDYLRAGAIARFSPVMTAVEKFANAGGMVIGICNGFQMLLESGLLPGAMRRNRDLAEAQSQAQDYARRTAARVRYGDAAGLLQVDAERTLATARLARVQSDMALAQAEVTSSRTVAHAGTPKMRATGAARRAARGWSVLTREP